MTIVNDNVYIRSSLIPPLEHTLCVYRYCIRLLFHESKSNKILAPSDI